MANVKRSFLQIAGIGAILGPVVMVIADAMHIFIGQNFVFTILLWLAFVLLIPGIIGLTYLSSSAGSKLAVFGGVVAYFGAMAGASMQVLFRVYAVLDEMGSPQTIDLLRGCFKLIATTQMIGLTFPIGLILLAISYYRSGADSFVYPLLLALGAVLFPVGRIAGAQWAVMASGILFVIVFVSVGRRLLSLANFKDDLNDSNI